MKLGTLRNGTRDGELVVVRRDHQVLARAAGIAPTLQAALDDWERVEPRLRELAAALERGTASGEPMVGARFGAPLPRAYEWVDGSAYLSHILLVRRARRAEPPPGLRTDPLVYQGGSGVLLGPEDDIPLVDPGHGLDFEGELAVILGDTPRGTRASEAERYIRLVTMVNDVTLRNLVPDELAKGFGFFVSKPASAFAPLAVTPDELGEAWRDGRVHLRLRVTLDDELVGDLETGPEMHFSFFDLVAHLARTRSYTAGTVLGSGTVSNEDEARGVSCLAERRMRETLASGEARTPFLKAGDRVTLELVDGAGNDVCGRISQRVSLA